MIRNVQLGAILGIESRIVGNSLWRTQSCSDVIWVDVDPRYGLRDPVQRARVRPVLRVSLVLPIVTAIPLDPRVPCSEFIVPGLLYQKHVAKIHYTQQFLVAYYVRIPHSTIRTYHAIGNIDFATRAMSLYTKLPIHDPPLSLDMQTF